MKPCVLTSTVRTYGLIKGISVVVCYFYLNPFKMKPEPYWWTAQICCMLLLFNPIYKWNRMERNFVPIDSGYLQIGKVCESRMLPSVARLSFNIWPFGTLKISPTVSQICQSTRLSILPNDKYTVNFLPKTCKLLPKWWNFAKFGHTDATLKGCFLIAFKNRQTLSTNIRSSFDRTFVVSLKVICGRPKTNLASELLWSFSIKLGW